VRDRDRFYRVPRCFEPRRNIDAVAHQVAITLLDHFAEVDADRNSMRRSCGRPARPQPRQCPMLIRACKPAVSDHIGRAAREIPNGNRKTARSTNVAAGAAQKPLSLYPSHYIPLAPAACAADASGVSPLDYNL